MAIRRNTQAQQAQAPIQPQQQPVHQGSNGSRPSLLKRGQAAQQARQHESERQFQQGTARRQPYRLWIPYQGSEEDRTKEVIILDSDISQCPAFYEHALVDPQSGKRTLTELCIKELGHCPLCEKHGDSYYVLMISIIELLASPFTRKDGSQMWHNKKLLPVKYKQQEWFYNTCRDVFNGNMRGARIKLTREANQRSPAIGVPQLVIEDGHVVQYPDSDLLESFGHAAIMSQDGVMLRPENDDIYPYNYDELFKTPTAEELRAQYGGMPPAGSQQEVQQTWGQNPPAQQRISARDVRQYTQAQQPQQQEDDVDLNDCIPF